MSPPPRVGADLRALVDRLWLREHDPDGLVAVGLGQPPPGRSVVEEYVVVPSLRRPSYLVPVASPAASKAAFGRYLTTSSSRTRALGRLSAVAFGGAVGEKLFRDRLYVGLDPSVGGPARAPALLLARVAAELAADDLVALLPVRRPGPNSKPTMQLFEREGEPLGYLKFGWSPATCAVVENEAAALSAIRGKLRQLDVPRLVASGRWGDGYFAVAEPLPPDVRPWRHEPSTTPELLRDIAGSGSVASLPLRRSGFARRLRDELVSAGAAEPQAVGVLLDWLSRLESREDVLQLGRWHGDFVPWNLGRGPTRTVAWDWEFSSDQVPLGFDLLHWHFQHRLSPANARLSAAVAVAEQAASRLSVLGVPPDSHRLVTSLYLLEMFTRNTRMAALGSGWNPKYHPAMLDVAASRDR